MMASKAQIFDKGHRRYEGERTGLGAAMLAVFKSSIRRSLGIRRSARYKVVPVLIVATSLIPAIALVAITLFFSGAEAETDGESSISTIPGYLSLVSVVLLLFAAFVGPDVLSSDRRSGMLSLYLTSTLDKASYLVAKCLAVFATLQIPILVPTALLLIAEFLTGSPGLSDIGFGVGRLVLSSLVLALLYMAVTLAASASTDQAGAATAISLAILLGGTGIGTLAAESEQAPDEVRLLDMMNLPVELASRLYGEPGTPEWSEISAFSMVLAFGAVVSASAFWVWFRYRSVVVTR